MVGITNRNETRTKKSSSPIPSSLCGKFSDYSILEMNRCCCFSERGTKSRLSGFYTEVPPPHTLLFFTVLPSLDHYDWIHWPRAMLSFEVHYESWYHDVAPRRMSKRPTRPVMGSLHFDIICFLGAFLDTGLTTQFTL